MKYGQRTECARQIYAMYRYFDTMSPAVFAASVGIMDTALMRVNIPWKYLSCFSAACFIISSKWIEDEYQPSIAELADLHYKQWKEVDLRRMEEKILQVLGWEMPRCTYLNFLPQMTKMLSSCQPFLPPITQVIRNAELLLLKEFSFVLKPAAVALGALEHTIRQCGAFTPDMSFAVVALQDFAKVLDSELHEIDQVLNSEESLPKPVYKSNKAYFPKVFETPCNSFCPDYRLYNILEECSDSDTEPRSRQDPAARYQSSPNPSISDYDYSDEESDEASSSAHETIIADSCKTSSGCTVLTDNTVKLSVGKDIEGDPRFHAGDVGKLNESLDAEHEQFSDAASDSAQRQHATEQTSTAKHSDSIPLATAPINNRDGYFSDEENKSDNDSGCEEDSDEQDSCGEQDSSEQDICSEQDSSEQDSGCDQDSDFHDSSPCRICHVKSCVDEVHGQALTFN